jgi:hypothetical protein
MRNFSFCSDAALCLYVSRCPEGPAAGKRPGNRRGSDRSSPPAFTAWDVRRLTDYFKYGVVDRAFITKEKKEYSDRWPTRRYGLQMGTLRATKIGEDTVITTFQFSYRVSNASQTRTGQGAAEVTLLKTSKGDYEVRAAKEILFR